jgi:ATP-dependent exoDNAse (exonuclease V) beta subunit
VTSDAYVPTKEQEAIIAHEGHAFVRACPGAGKTRTMVERARHMLTKSADRRGVAQRRVPGRLLPAGEQRPPCRRSAPT